MKKKITLTSVFTIFLSIAATILMSCLIFVHQSNQKLEKEIKNYLHIASQLYNGENEKEVMDYFHSFSIYIAIFSEDGDLIQENQSSNENITLSSPEMMQLGECFYRYSNVLNAQSVYVACKDGNDYICMALPQSNFSKTITALVFYCAILFILLTITTYFIDNYFYNQSILPLQKAILQMNIFTGKKEHVETNDLDLLTLKLNEIETIMHQKFNQIEQEKKESAAIIEKMNQGFILLDEQLNVIMMNSMVEFYFKVTKKEVLNKNYIYLIRDSKLNQAILDCHQNKKDSKIELNFQEKHFVIFIQSLSNRIGVFVLDDTMKYKIAQSKQDFFANASHELKSPLTAIIGYQQMIQQGIIETKEEIVEATEKTLKEAQRMNQMVVDMLELSRLESEIVEVSEKIDLKQAITNAIELLTINAKKKKITFDLDLESFYFTMSEKDASHLIMNLIDNAIKYGNEFGTIKISISNKNHTIKIEDDGIGIAKKHQERIFERFYQVDKDRSKNSGGTGLGLAIVKHICVKYNIEIRLKSQLGKGTSIQLIFN